MKTLPAPPDQAREQASKSFKYLSPHPIHSANQVHRRSPRNAKLKGRQERKALATNNRHTNPLPRSKPSNPKFASPPSDKRRMSTFQTGGLERLPGKYLLSFKSLSVRRNQFPPKGEARSPDTSASPLSPGAQGRRDP